MMTERMNYVRIERLIDAAIARATATAALTTATAPTTIATATTTTILCFVLQLTYAIASTMMIAKSKENTKANQGETILNDNNNSSNSNGNNTSNNVDNARCRVHVPDIGLGLDIAPHSSPIEARAQAEAVVVVV